MNDIVKIKSLPFIVLSAVGHCGGDFVANLFFGHEQILKLPPLLFFRKIRILRDLKNIDLIEIKDNNKVFKILKKEFFSNKRLTSYNFNLNKKQEILFKKYFFEFLKKSGIKERAKNLFLAINYASAKVYKININKLKYIFVDEHKIQYCNDLKKYFKKNKFLIVYRDPRAAIAGTLRGGNDWKLQKQYQIDRAFFSWFTGLNFYLKEKKNNNVFFFQNEIFTNKKYLKKMMKNLSRALCIKFSKSLLTPKYFNKKWYGDSVYLGKFEMKKQMPKDYYKPKNVKLRWLKQLSKQELIDIENILRKSMKLFKYKPITKITFKTIINSYINYFFSYKNTNQNFFKNILYTTKTIARRMMIINFPHITSKIFDLK